MNVSFTVDLPGTPVLLQDSSRRPAALSMRTNHFSESSDGPAEGLGRHRRRECRVMSTVAQLDVT